jgi:hypothetical protein
MVQIKKSELNKQIYISIYNTYLEHLRNNTFLGEVTQHKAKVVNDWDLKKTQEFGVFIFSNPNYFDIYRQEEGIKPQIIKAKNKKFMRFKKPTSRKSSYKKIPGNIAFEKDGYIYAKMINHPGFEARRFIQKMLLNEELWNSFTNQVNDNIDKLIDSKVNEAQKELDKT